MRTGSARALTLAVLVGLLAPGLTAAADPLPAAGRLGRAVDPGRAHRPGVVVAKLREGVDPARILPGARPILGRWYEVPVGPNTTPMRTVKQLVETRGVELAELEYLMRAGPIGAEALAPGGSRTLSIPNDPGYPFQWHFPQVQADSAWDVSTGAGVTVAVIDSGISQGGEDLDCHTFVSPFNAITNAAGSAQDDNGHGTHVSGTVAQCTNNGLGVAGLAHGADLMPIKATNSAGSATTADIAQSIDWARSNGAGVINMSLGTDCTTTWPTCSASVVNDAIELAAADDVVIVVASGNSGLPYVAFPANHPDVIAVGATRFDQARAPYSSYGAALDLMAPGGDVLDQNGDGYMDGVLQETFAPTWGYYFAAGTSMAAPHVAGAAAILRSAVPSASRQEVVDALYLSATDLGGPGFDTMYGNGLLQVRAALEQLVDGSGAGPPDAPPCTVSGDEGPNVLVGTPGDDVICGFGGRDVIAPGAGNDVVLGGAGRDIVDYRDAPSSVTVDLQAGAATGGAGEDTIQGIEGIIGSAFDDHLIGNRASNDFYGMAGNDSIHGGPGSDRARFDLLPSGVRVNLVRGRARGQGADSLRSIEALQGSRRADRLIGDRRSNALSGGGGKDRLEGSGGDDRLRGERGADTLLGGRGDDRLIGGPGRDVCVQGAGIGVSRSC